MDSNAHEDSKISSEEDDRSEQGYDDHMGTGRSYECVFCKRGFTTAQALGGHMNIHRKDRAKNRLSSVIPSTSEKIDENYTSFRSYMPFQSYPSTHHFSMASSEVHINYQTFFPSSSWDEGSMHTNHSNDFHSYGKHPQHLNLFRDDVWRGNLSLRVGPPHTPEDNSEKREGASEEEDELDLELRLGHDP